MDSMKENLPSDEAVSIAVRHEIGKLRAQIERTENARVVLKDTLVAFVQDHIQETIQLREFKRRNERVVLAASAFVANVENKLIEGAAEMPLRCDESYRALRDAVKQSPVDLNGGGRFA